MANITSNNAPVPDGVAFCYDPVVHPLGNQVILRNLFQLCPPGLLAKCRLVSKSWHDLSLPSWRRRTTPRLYYDKKKGISLSYSDIDFGPTPVVSPDEDSLSDQGDPEENTDDSVDEDIDSSADGTAESSEEEAESSQEGAQSSDDEDDDKGLADSDQGNPSTDDEGEEDEVPTKLGIKNSIQEFLNFVGDSESQYLRLPHSRFALKLWNFHDKRLDGFWKPMGSHISRLFLYRCTFPGPEEFRRIIYTACPNLQILSVVHCFFDAVDPAMELEEELQYQEPVLGENKNLWKLTLQTFAPEDGNLIPVTWMELLSHFPNVEFLSIWWYFHVPSNTAQLLKALQAINTIRDHDPSKLPIRLVSSGSILVPNNGPGEIFRLLRQLRIGLEHLNLKVEPDVQGETMKSILEPYIKTLKGLAINGTTGPSIPFGLRTDIWTNLSTLYIPADHCPNFEFLVFTPNLKNLRLTDHSLLWNEPQFKETAMIRNTSMERMTSGKLPNVTSFRFEYLVSEEDLRSLIEWMPNLMYLSLVLDDTLFAIACDHWRNLKDFAVNGDSMTDEGITGRRPENRDGEGEPEVGPNITYLQALEDFRSEYVKLTELSVIHGFAKLPKLNYLEVHHTSELGEEGLKALKANRVRVELTRR